MEEYLLTRAAFEALQRKHPTVIPKGFGFQCGRGWIDILDRFFGDLEKLLPMEVDFQLRQVKEKVAGLRIYYRIETDIPDDLMWDICRLVDLAEIRSFRTCETCGRPGGIWNRHGFYLTACDRHAAEHSEGYASKAVPVPREGPTKVKLRAGWFRYDEDLDDLVPSDPPEGWVDR